MGISAIKGLQVNLHFPVFTADGVTPYVGLVQSDFEAHLFRDGSESSIPVSIIEIDSTGFYTASFTPDEAGAWQVSLLVEPTDDWVGEDVDVILGNAESQMNGSYEESTNTLWLEVWLDRNGRSVASADLVSCSVTLTDSSGTDLFTESSSSPKPDGKFSLSSSLVLSSDSVYNAIVTVTDSLGTVSTSQSFTTFG